MVSCFPTTNCDGGEWVNGTSLNDCCQHGMEPFGLSYTISGLEGCQLCPVGKIINHGTDLHNSPN